MGRGLSELQREILRIVYERRQGRDFEAEERRWHEHKASVPGRMKALFGDTFAPGYDLAHPEIIARLYDWPVSSWLWGEREPRRLSEGGRVHPFIHNFRREVIGLEEYKRRMASYHRAVGRLKRRGLLTLRGNPGRRGLWITDEGIRVAENLSVSSDPESGITLGESIERANMSTERTDATLEP